MTTPSWSEWLRAQLDEREWRNADLVNRSQNTIKADRVSKWLNGKETPSYRLAIVTANTLGVERAEALTAAGFGDEVPAADAPPPVTLETASDADLLRELLRRIESGNPDVLRGPIATVTPIRRVEDLPAEEFAADADHPVEQTLDPDDE